MRLLVTTAEADASNEILRTSDLGRIAEVHGAGTAATTSALT